MNNILSKIFIFATGAAAGSVVTWAILKPKYEQLVQEEIDSYKDELRKQSGRCQNVQNDDQTPCAEEEDEEEEDLEQDQEAYNRFIKELGYSTNSANESAEEEEEEEEGYSEEEYGIHEGSGDMIDPYVISHIECGECDYEIVTLMYYADGVLAHPTGDIIDNIDEVIGEESLQHFGEYEEDTVYVRNDSFGIDYVVLKDECTYWGDVNDENAD